MSTTCRQLVYYPDPVLRKVCEDMEHVSDDVPGLVQDMIRLMKENAGVGIAAPQVGSLKRVFVMAGLPAGNSHDGAGRSLVYEESRAFYNPRIISRTSETVTGDEGCLSVPDVTAGIERYAGVTLRFMNQDGTWAEEEFSGLAAICVQHEVDHLDGVMFIDYLGSVKRSMILNKMKKYRKSKGID